MADYTVDPLVAADLTKVIYTNSEQENVAIQVVTDSDFTASTAAVTLRESNDRLNWNNIEDSSGNAVTISLTAANTSYMLKTGIWYCKYLQVFFTAGDASDGTAAITANVKE